MTFEGAAQATTLDGAATKMETQTIARGPGGGPGGDQAGRDQRRRLLRPELGPPVREPVPLEQPASIVSIVVLPMASIVMAGLMLRNMRHALVIYGVMLAFLVAGAVVAISAEVRAERGDRGPAGGPRAEHGGQGGPARPGGRGAPGRR